MPAHCQCSDAGSIIAHVLGNRRIFQTSSPEAYCVHLLDLFSVERPARRYNMGDAVAHTPGVGSFPLLQLLFYFFPIV